MNKKELIKELETISQHGKITIENKGDNYYGCTIEFSEGNGEAYSGDYGLENALNEFIRFAKICIKVDRNE